MQLKLIDKIRFYFYKFYRATCKVSALKVKSQVTFLFFVILDF